VGIGEIGSDHKGIERDQRGPRGSDEHVVRTENLNIPLSRGPVHPLTTSEPNGTRTADHRTMSRRESRVSINIRQNDALLEFENCKLMKPAGHTRSDHPRSVKKRFLLANKHITK
jgi:hypothetical protein